VITGLCNPDDTVCTVDSDCDDDELCTIDDCTDDGNACTNTPVVCPPGQHCDSETGFCLFDTTGVDVSLQGGRIIVPNATIVADGLEYRGDAGVILNGLVGIIREDTAYLYHTDLGSVDLTTATTEQAMGAFLVERLDAAQSKMARSSKSLVAVRAKSLDIGSSTELANGLTVRRLDKTRYSFTNSTQRWAAIKGPDGPVYLPPAIAEGTVDYIRTLYELEIPATTATIDVSENAVIDTYASMMSLAALFTPSLANAVSLADVALDGVTFSQITQHAQEALDHDQELFITLNMLELTDITLALVEKINGLIPGDCINPAVWVTSGVRARIRSFLTDGDLWIWGGFVVSRVEDIIICACDATVAGIPV